ncbi:hypothetical protein FHX76_000089 [Lysinibacter cavernae]|uniref:Uncharacterized protein n=1 Tax=Lysinibacter cavernae TaxID=1640652 RepID=A0A7X5TRI5_9MICO|nr:hypothetical protein [Lysinibacter cavernae]
MNPNRRLRGSLSPQRSDTLNTPSPTTDELNSRNNNAFTDMNSIRKKVIFSMPPNTPIGADICPPRPKIPLYASIKPRYHTHNRHSLYPSLFTSVSSSGTFPPLEQTPTTTTPHPTLNLPQKPSTFDHPFAIVGIEVYTR